MSVIAVIIKISGAFKNLGSFLMKSLLRLNGATIGKNTFVSMSSRIVAKKLVIGNNCVVKAHVMIRANEVLIGNSCIISEHSYITGKNNLLVGDKSFIGKKVRINTSRNVVIGNDVGVGENSVIWTHGYFPPADEGYPVTYAPVTIGDGTWVSTNIIILPGITIGKGVIVGAGSVVTKSFADHVLIAGNPAKFIKNTSDIRSKAGFTSIMREIFSNYPSMKKIEDQDEFLKYRSGSFFIYVLHEGHHEDCSKIDKKNSLVIFKNISEAGFFIKNNYQWFDLTAREYRFSTGKEVQMIIEMFQEWGIRLVAEYN